MDREKEKSLVSVLMTAYNREKYIAEAIQSVIASSYQNWELIIVDDCSTDKTFEIAKQYQAKDERIKVYINKKNLGDYPNRNKAARYAKGKYLKYLDADDLIYWYGLDVMVKSMEQFPEAAVGLCHSKSEEYTPYPYKVSPKEAYSEHFLGRGLFNYGPTGMIINREIFEKNNGFCEKKYTSDTEFLYRVGAKYSTVKMAPGLVWWRQHEGQQIKDEIKDLYIIIERYQMNLDFINKKFSPFSTDLKRKATIRLKQHFARKILAIAIKKNKFKDAYKLFRLSKLSLFELLKGLKSYE